MDQGQPRVVITGIGLSTALAPTRDASWRRLRLGEHGLIRLDDPDGHFGAPVPGGVDPLATAREAFTDAGLDRHDFRRDRAGVAFGLSKGRIDRLARLHAAGLAHLDGPAFLSAWPHAASAAIAGAFGLRGPCLAPVAACATGLIAALQGAHLIRRGLCDLVLAGAADASLTPFVLAAFRKMGVLSRGEDPARAIRPWDRDRSGFLVGEGAAVLVLERDDHARARGATPYAVLSGGAFGADAHHVTALNPDPANLAALIRRALDDARVPAALIDHANVHGTATPGNDPLECRALRLALGPHADSVACSASKPQIGHTLGAAGAVELAFTALAVRDAFVPPTLNLDHPDPLCDLDGTPHVGRALPIRAALKLSLGFGGHLAVAVLTHPEGSRP